MQSHTNNYVKVAMPGTEGSRGTEACFFFDDADPDQIRSAFKSARELVKSTGALGATMSVFRLTRRLRNADHVGTKVTRDLLVVPEVGSSCPLAALVRFTRQAPTRETES